MILNNNKINCHLVIFLLDGQKTSSCKLSIFPQIYPHPWDAPFLNKMKLSWCDEPSHPMKVLSHKYMTWYLHWIWRFILKKYSKFSKINVEKIFHLNDCFLDNSSINNPKNNFKSISSFSLWSDSTFPFSISHFHHLLKINFLIFWQFAFFRSKMAIYG